MVLIRWLAVAMALAATIVAAPVSAKSDVIVIPPTYHAKQQPPVAVQSFMLTLVQQGGNWEDKYRHVVNLLATDQRLMGHLQKAAKTYGVDPVDLVGAIVGEHTFNMNVFDSLQTYYVKALQYVNNKSLMFEYKGELAKDFFKRPQFADCEAMKDNYAKWDCRETVWNRQFAGKAAGGKTWPPTRLNRVFFQPMFSGQTFGVGQLGPIVALSVTDIVHRKSGLPLLSIDNAPQVFSQIMNPDASMYYIAASIRLSIDNYKTIAGFDISQNAGIVATLYNLGDSAPVPSISRRSTTSAPRRACRRSGRRRISTAGSSTRRSPNCARWPTAPTRPHSARHPAGKGARPFHRACRLTRRGVCDGAWLG